jgi:hypothetical protein
MKFKVRMSFIQSVAVIYVLAMLLTLVIALTLSSCGRPEDLPQSKTAIVQLPDGEVVEGEVSDVMRWSDGWIEIVIDGVKYKTNEINVVIIEK